MALIIATIGALSGWGGIFYNWFTSTPKIDGRILGLMTGEWMTPQFKEPKTGIFVYLYLVNRRKNPVHILDYELQFDVGNGYEKALRVYGTRNMPQPSFGSETQDITIPNFSEKLIYSKNNPIEYGVPLHGFAFFGTDKPHKDIMNKIKRIKIICVDAFNNTHEIFYKEKQPLNLYLLQDIANIDVKQKKTN